MCGAVRCFGSHGARGAVFCDARVERTARGVCGAIFRDTAEKWHIPK